MQRNLFQSCLHHGSQPCGFSCVFIPREFHTVEVTFVFVLPQIHYAQFKDFELRCKETYFVHVHVMVPSHAVSVVFLCHENFTVEVTFVFVLP